MKRWYKAEKEWPTGLKTPTLELREAGQVLAVIHERGMSTWNCLFEGCPENLGTTDVDYLKRVAKSHVTRMHAGTIAKMVSDR